MEKGALHTKTPLKGTASRPSLFQVAAFPPLPLPGFPAPSEPFSLLPEGPPHYHQNCG